MTHSTIHVAILALQPLSQYASQQLLLSDPGLPDMQISQPLVPLVDEFAGRLFGELDYLQEGRSCEKFAKLYAHVPRVRTPGE